MIVERVLVVLAGGIPLISITCLLLYIFRVRTFLYYLILPTITFANGYALAWAYNVTNADLALVLAVMGALFGLQGAWVLTARIPRL